METGSLGCLTTVLQHPEEMVLDLQHETVVGFLKVRSRSFGEICPPLEEPPGLRPLSLQIQGGGLSCELSPLGVKL